MFTKLDSMTKEEYDIVGDKIGRYVAKNPIIIGETSEITSNLPKATPKFLLAEDFKHQLPVEESNDNPKPNILHSKRSSIIECVNNPYTLKFSL